MNLPMSNVLTPHEEAVREWLIKADNDARSAKALSLLTPPILDTAGYHCQQAAEKALKGLMLFHHLPLTKTHNLTLLVGNISVVEPHIMVWLPAAQYLTPFATLFRYPAGGGNNDPTPAEFSQALSAATDIIAFVHSVLPSHILSL
jgi:HEPN domain-containing protein